MKLSVTKIFCAALIVFLLLAWASTGRTQKQEDCGKRPGHGNPPWFNAGEKCNNKQSTYIFAGTVGWPQRNETHCSLYIHICSLELKRNTIQPLGSKCPEAKDFAQPTFCCDEFNKAVKSKQPCDPKEDADCDGIPNDKDADPLKPDQKSPPPPVTQNMVDQAIRNEFQERNLKLPSYYTPDLIRQNPNGWGFAIPMDDSGMPIVIIGSVQQAPDGSMSVNTTIWRHVKDNATGKWRVDSFPGGNPQSSGSGGCGQDGLNHALGASLDNAKLSRFKTGNAGT